MAEDRKALHAKLLRGKDRAAAQRAAIEALNPLELEAFRPLFTDYFLAKFLLTREELDREPDFEALCALSIAKSARLDPRDLADLEAAQDCDGVTTAMAKKVLLFRAIETEFGVTVDARASAKIKTVEDLVFLGWNALPASPKWRERIRE